MSNAIAMFKQQRDDGVAESETTLAKLLRAHPDLVNDVATGGALPLHTAGMSRANQHAAAFLITRGGDIEAVDTYGFTPLDRMASNNLGFGALALLEAGADPSSKHSGSGGPMKIAQQAEAGSVIDALKATRGNGRRTDGTAVRRVEVFSETHPEIAGRYDARDGAIDIPSGFVTVCEDNGWDSGATWGKLNGGEGNVWFKHADNASYLYHNAVDGMWWIDGPDGLGVYKGAAPSWAPPGGSIRWTALDGGTHRPTLAVFRK
jgi:hypothetical protein